MMEPRGEPAGLVCRPQPSFDASFHSKALITRKRRLYALQVLRKSRRPSHWRQAWPPVALERPEPWTEAAVASATDDAHGADASLLKRPRLAPGEEVTQDSEVEFDVSAAIRPTHSLNGLPTPELLRLAAQLERRYE
mmetsp:Transcript_49675/g.139052  ORF Transcript_49675/g.139052 Transcript_49675/m.139052 type:complete len:137 (-) Transcript_49675:144-554(-)